MLGIGTMDEQNITKREIIHQLCIAPMSYSELTKGLPVNVSCYHFKTNIHLKKIYSDVCFFLSNDT